jgi:hypothetical protein
MTAHVRSSFHHTLPILTLPTLTFPHHVSAFRRLLWIALCLVMAMVGSLQAQMFTRWEPANGPFGGGVRLISNGFDALFVGTSTGGVFRLRSFSTAWEPANNGLGGDLNIAALYALPNERTIYAATQERNFYSSTDNGTTWSKLSTLQTRVLSIVQFNSVLYVATDFGVMRSSDNGRSFQMAGIISNPDPNIRTSQVQSITAANGILYTSGQAGLFRSSDGGTTWTFVQLTSVATQTGISASSIIVESVWSDGSTVYAASSVGPLVSTDNGLSWSRRGTRTFGISRVLVAQNTLFALSGGRIWRSGISGENWLEITSVGLQQSIEGTSGSVYLGGAAGVFRSNDNGLSWNPSNTGITAVRVNALQSFGGATLAGTSTDGVFRATGVPFNTQWQRSGLDNLGIVCFAHMMSGSTLVTFAGTEAGVFRSLDTGRTWSSVWTNANVDTTTTTSSLPSGERILSLAMMGNTVFAGTNQSGLYRSRNLGQTWQQVGSRFSPIRSMVSAFGRLYITHGTDIEMSLDSGRTWAVIRAGISSVLANTLAVRLSTLYLGLEGSSTTSLTDAGVLSSKDSGRTWNRISDGLSSSQITSLLPIGSDIVVGTRDAGIFTSPDSVIAWRQMNTGIPDNTILCFSLDNSEPITATGTRFGTLFVGTASRGVYQSRWNTTSVSQAFTPLEGSTFPNPVGNMLAVEARVQKNALVVIRLLSMTGTHLVSLQEQAHGDYLRSTLDVSSLPAGAYILEVLDGAHRFTSKVVKQ